MIEIKETIAKKILSYLEDYPEGANIQDISIENYVEEGSVRSCIARLKKKGKVKVIGKDPLNKKWNLYTIVKDKDGESRELLKKLYSLMTKKMEFDGIPNDEDISLIKKIAEMI